MIYRIPEQHIFPPPGEADESGILGVGGDLDPRRVYLAYRMGIFPWYSDPQPILWWSPDPRMVLFPERLRIPRSLGKRIRQRRYRVTMDRAFGEVVRRCKQKPRPGQDGTWITAEMLACYDGLFQAGVAHSIEAWDGDRLVGGLFGVSLGRVFAGDSMFADAPDASKVAFVHFVRQFQLWGGTCIDSQVHTEHLERFGGELIPRRDYLALLESDRDQRLRTSPWSFDSDFECDGR